MIGERPSETIDRLIVEHLISTGELIELTDEVLRTLLARRPDMN